MMARAALSKHWRAESKLYDILPAGLILARYNDDEESVAAARHFR